MKTVFTIAFLICSFAYGQVLNPEPPVVVNAPSDTLKCLMLVMDSATLKVYGLRGYTVGALYDADELDLDYGHTVPDFITPHYFLDDKKQRLNSKIIIWKAVTLFAQSKPISRMEKVLSNPDALSLK